jgi:hypothetical protein
MPRHARREIGRDFNDHEPARGTAQAQRVLRTTSPHLSDIVAATVSQMEQYFALW